MKIASNVCFCFLFSFGVIIHNENILEDIFKLNNESMKIVLPFIFIVPLAVSHTDCRAQRKHFQHRGLRVEIYLNKLDWKNVND